MITIDVSDLVKYGAELAAAADKLVERVRPAVKATADQVVETMKADMSGSGHFGQVAESISAEMAGSGAFSEAKVGPVKGSPGSLANIAYFGGANGGGGTVRDPQEALDEHAADFEKTLGDLLEGLL